MALPVLIASTLLLPTLAKDVSSITSAQWQSLNQTVGGRLHVGTPAALPCYVTYNNGTGAAGSGQTVLNSPNAAACVQWSKGDTNGPSIASYFGGYEVPNWQQCVATSKGCTLDPALPVDPVTPLTQTCYQGGVPSMYIDCQSVSDVQAGVAFATKNGLPLVIKNTGHDHRGRSSGPNTFALWTHNLLSGPQQLYTGFTPDGCSANAGPALTYGAGSEFGTLYDYVHQQGYTVGFTVFACLIVYCADTIPACWRCCPERWSKWRLATRWWPQCPRQQLWSRR